MQNAFRRAHWSRDIEVGNYLMPESLPAELTGRPKEVVASPGNIEITEEGIDLESILNNIERAILLQALSKAKGVKKHAAKLLGITFRSMRYRLEKHNLDAET